MTNFSIKTILTFYFITVGAGNFTTAQEGINNPYLAMDSIGKFGSLHGNDVKNWRFDIKSGSSLTLGLWEHILPKSVIADDKIVISHNELVHFTNRDKIQIETKGTASSIPVHWENRFGKQIQTLSFSKPLHVLVVKESRLVPLTLDNLEGVRYATYYPKGEFDVLDQNDAPIVYRQQNKLESGTPILLVTSRFLEHIDLEKAKIHRSTQVQGTEEYSETLLTLSIDFNDDGQPEVLMYQIQVEDTFAMEGDEGVGNQPSSTMGLYFENCWYRTSFWQMGQDGLEGF